MNQNGSTQIGWQKTNWQVRVRLSPTTAFWQVAACLGYSASLSTMSGPLASFVKRASAARNVSPFNSVSRSQHATKSLKPQHTKAITDTSVRSNNSSMPTLTQTSEYLKQSYQKSRAAIGRNVVTMQRLGYVCIVSLYPRCMLPINDQQLF